MNQIPVQSSKDEKNSHENNEGLKKCHANEVSWWILNAR